MLLHQTDPDVAVPLAEVSPEAQRTFTYALLEYLYRQIPIHLAGEVMHALRAAQYGDSPLRGALLRAAKSADRECLGIEEQLERDGDFADPALKKRWDAECRVSCAFSAGYHALDADPAEAVGEAVYQAFGAVTSQEVIDLLYAHLGLIPRRLPGTPGRMPTQLSR